MRLRNRPVFWFALLLAAAILFSVAILPGIVRNVAVEKLEQATGRKASIAKIRINPFTLSAKIDGFRMEEKGGGAVFASFSSARFKVSPASLTKRALIVSKFALTSPSLRLVRTAPNTYNFSDLLARKRPADERPLLFSINNIEISNGSIDFNDRAVGNPTSHTIRNMKLNVPFVSNIPYLADIHVAPHFSALVNGARLSADGRLRPLDKAAETSFIITLKNADIPHYLAYLPFSTQIRATSGTLSTTTEIRYRVSARSQPEISLSGAIGLKKLQIVDRNNNPLLSLDRGLLRINRADILTRNFDLASLDTAGLEVFIERNAAGVWTWQQFLEKPASTEKKPKGAESAPIRFRAGLIRSRNSTAHFHDRLPPGGFTAAMERIDVTIRNLSTAKGNTADWNVSLQTDHGESLAIRGALTLLPLAASAQAEGKELDAARYYPYLANLLTAPVNGRLDFSGSVAFSGAEGLRIDDLSVDGRELAARYGNNESARLSSVSLKGGSFSLNGKHADIASIAISGGDIALSREKDGRLSPTSMLHTVPASSGGRAGRTESSSPLTYRIGQVDGQELNITMTDRSRQGMPSFPLRGLRFTLKEINEPDFGNMPFTLATAYGKKGSLEFTGTILPAPLKIKGTADLKRIPLRDFDAYLPDNFAVSIAGGALDSRMTFDLAQTAGKTTGTFAGSLGIRSFYCLDVQDNEDLLKWERLQLSGIRGTVNPFGLTVGTVALTNYFSRVIIGKDGTLNLQHLARGPAQPSPETDRPQPAAATQPGKKGPVRIGAVTLQGGTMVFSDRHLQSPFTTTFYNLGGRISGLASDENRYAEVDLRGNLENHSPLTITGTINPLRDDLFVDLKINFADIELSPVTPYSGTYLGYAVDKGKLFMELHYRIENKNLSSENKLFFDQLTFGRKIESDKATSLPVRLAVALLKDRKGEIHLDLPVTGRTDDPQFSIWSLVFQVLRNLLVKAATSPFALLQAAFGGSEDFSSVSFAPGSASLTKTEQEKLLKLAEAIQDRPGLSVEISGYVDKGKDPEGYRNELLSKKMRTEKFLALVKEKKNRPDQTPDTTELLPDEYSAYLKAVYRKEKFPKPRNFIGMQKDLPDDEMRKLIFANTIVGETELKKLAQERAAAVQNFLVAKGNLAAERVFLKSDDIYKAPGKEGLGASRVEFGAIAK